MRQKKIYLIFKIDLIKASEYLAAMLKKIQMLFKRTENPLDIYKIVGQESGTQLLVKNFYDKMQSDLEAKECLLVHELENGRVPQSIQDKFFMFLSGWFGGPNLFVENFGHPRMRSRHMHVPITNKEAEQWLYCMKHALLIHRPKISKKHQKTMLNSFKALAIRITNT